jgi:hypothetical protein
MKLTRNKIRKIRKQQHQSVRKWKKPRNSIRRKVSTFRQTPLDLVPKRTNVFNKTLKNYIPLPVLCYLKQKYIEVKRLRRKQRKQQRMNMIGGRERADPETLALRAISTAKANSNNGPKSDSTKNNPAAADVSNEDGENAKKDENATGDDVTTTGKDSNDAAAAPGEDAKEKGADGKTDGDKGDKKPGSFNLGPEVPGDVSINSETHEFKDVKRLLDFLVKKGLPYYIQIELKRGIPLNLKETSIFDLRRILYGKFVKGGDNTDLHFKPGGDYVGIANGSILTNEYPNDVFIFTKDKVNIDQSSEDTSIKVKAGEKMIPPLSDSKRLYKLLGDTPSSIDDVDQIDKVAITSTDEFRLQVAPLSDADLKNAAAAAPSDDKKKKKKIVSDDTPSYVVNLNDKCKITSVQTLRKSLEVVRADLEDEDEISKSNAMEVFKMLISLLNNPAFAKNDGFDDFKETVYGFTYKIPGTERKYGFIQLMSFFDQKKDDLPPDLTKQFFKLLTLLGHGPAGENGACLAFERPQSIEVIEYVKTLENGDIVTTKKLGSKTNIEGFGSELDKLNATNAPKEEDEKKDEKKDEAGGKEGESAKTEKPAPDPAAPATETTPAAPAAEAAPAPAPEPAPADEPAPAAKTSMMAEENKAQEASAVAIASIALSEAQAAQKAEPPPVTMITPDKEKPSPPLPPSQEVVAINKLYEKSDKNKKKEKIGKILYLRKNFDKRIKEIAPLLLDIFKKSNESYKNNQSKENKYIKDAEYKQTMKTLKGYIESFKKSENYKYVEDQDSCCDKIVSELIPNWYSGPEKRDNARKICPLFTNYAHYMREINESYEYFNHHENMKPVFGASLWGATKKDIEDSFNNSINNLNMVVNNLEKEETYTKELEKQLRPETAQQTV